MRRHRTLLTILAGLLLVVLAPVAGAQGGSIGTLVDIRAAHHPGFDRIVFEFEGGLPDLLRAGWSATPPTLDPSGMPSHVQGSAFLSVVFGDAVGYRWDGEDITSAYGPARRAYDLPNIAHVVTVGDWEAVMEIVVGVMHRPELLRVTSLYHPARWVFDIGTSFPKRTVRVWYLDRDLVDGPPPYVVPVTRQVPVAGAARATLQRLFAGPTIPEKAAGLRFIASDATGFADLRINDLGVARVRLTGGCDGGGSTIATIATELTPTLRALPRVDWVKVYDPAGTTDRPWGLTDSIPACLEP